MQLHPESAPRPLSGMALFATGEWVAAENHFHKVLFRASADGLLALWPSVRWPITFENHPEETFGTPVAVAADLDGNVYAVNGSSAVCKISPAGVAHSLVHHGKWSTVPGHDIQRGAPCLASVVVDGEGTVFLADELGLKVYTLTPDGHVDVLIDFNAPEVLRVVSGGLDVVTTAAFIPSGMALSACGSLYIAGRAQTRHRRIHIRVLKCSMDGNRELIAIEDDAHDIWDASSRVPGEPSDWPQFISPHPLHPRLSYPVALAVDRQNNLFVADYAKNLIRQVSPSGSVTRLAGSGRFELGDGCGTSASFRQPRGLAVDAAGLLQVQDPDPHVIRRVSPEGVVTTLRLQEAKASFHQPMGVAVGPDGVVYVADAFNHRVCKITPGGTTITLARTGAPIDNGPPGSLADFGAPCALTVDTRGHVYVCGKHLYRISPDGVVRVHAGRISGPGNDVATEPCDGAAEEASFRNVRGMDIDREGNIYLTDAGPAGLVRAVSRLGRVTTLATLEGACFMGLALGADGCIYVSSVRGEVYRLSPGDHPSFTLDHVFASYSAFGLAADAHGAVYLALTHPGKVMVRSPAGNWDDLAGAGISGAADGQSDQARFSSPVDVAVDMNGTVYVADSANNLVRKINRDGWVSTLAGSGIRGAADTPVR